MNKINPFHLAFPVSNLEDARDFYVDILGCDTGRSSDHWIDFNFFGHQLVAHISKESEINIPTNKVDGKDVPIQHFGIVLDWPDWELLSERLKAKQITFIIEPHIRFKGEPGEQATMFFLDPSGNALEFKAFKDQNQIFATT